jgi:hypothetical protein
MVPGVRKQWKQVIAYNFTSKKEIMSQLQDIGLNVLGTVCDQRQIIAQL